jgi:chromosome segregation ATPase
MMPTKDQLKAELKNLEAKRKENDRKIERSATRVEDRTQELSMFQMFGTEGKVPDRAEENRIEDLKEDVRYERAKLGILRDRKNKLERDIEKVKDDINKKK